MTPKQKQLQWRNDPELFIKEVLDDSPRWSKQIEAMESVRDNANTYIKAGHGIGKTYCASDIVIWFLFTHYPSTVITTAPSWPQVEKLLWAEINTKIGAMRLKNTGITMLKTEMRFDDTGKKWFAMGLSPKVDKEDAGKRMTGFHNEHMLVVFDEGPSVPPALWTIKETILTSANSKFLAIGNPIGEGAFKQGYSNTNNSRIDMSIFTSPNFTANNITNVKHLIKLANMEHSEREKQYKKFKIPMAWLTTPMWAVDRLIEWGVDSPLFEARVLGIFPKKTIGNIISYSDCEIACTIEPDINSIKTLGVDVARFGDDNTVLYGYHNGKRTHREVNQGKDIVSTANRIIHLVKEDGYKVVVIDDTGLGGGVTDILNNAGINANIIPINFAQSAINKDKYSSVVSEMYFEAGQHIKDGDIKMVDDGNLIKELSARKYEYDNKGRYKIESKDNFKKRIGGSPDEADAFVLCLYGMFQPQDNEIYVEDGILESTIY